MRSQDLLAAAALLGALGLAWGNRWVERGRDLALAGAVLGMLREEWQMESSLRTEA